LNELLLLFIIFPGLLYFLIGFVYHYYRNKTYWNVAIESIIIGFIFGYFMQADGIGFAEWTLTNILIIFISGILALKIRRSSGSKLPENDEKAEKNSQEVYIDKINDKIGDKPEKDKNIEDKFSKYPIMKSDKFKPFKEPIPLTPPKEVKIYPYNIKNSFKSFGRISVRSDKSLESKTAAMDEIGNKLEEKASNLGANAVIMVRYQQGIFTLFRGIRGVGRAVYIEDLENVEKANPPSGYLLVFGVLWVLLGLLGLNDYYQFYIPFGLFMIISGIFTRRGYINKTFFLALAGVITLLGLQLVRYILKNNIQLYNLEFYLGTAFFAILLIVFIYSYKRRKDDSNLEWRDNWGFK
jgi:hypothetical protein